MFQSINGGAPVSPREKITKQKHQIKKEKLPPRRGDSITVGFPSRICKSKPPKPAAPSTGIHQEHFHMRCAGGWRFAAHPPKVQVLQVANFSILGNAWTSGGNVETTPAATSPALARSRGLFRNFAPAPWISKPDHFGIPISASGKDIR